MDRIVIEMWLQNLYTSEFLMEVSDDTVRPYAMVLKSFQYSPDVGFHSLMSEIARDRLRLRCDYVSMLECTMRGGQPVFCVFLTTSETGELSHLSKLHLNWIDLDGKLASSIPSQLHSYMESATEISERKKISSSLASISDEVSSKAMGFLRAKLVNRDEITGWPHYLGRDQVGALSTSLGILSFLHSGAYFSEMPLALRTVREFQNEDGGWPVRSLIGRSAISITESTLYVLWALLRADLGARDQSVLKAVEWLEHVQKGDGGWGSSGHTDRSRVFPTAFSLQILCMIDDKSNAVRSGVSWLLNARNSDGGWGFYSHDSPDSSSSNAHHTAQAVLGLLAAGIGKESEIIRKGCEYILGQFSEDVEEGWGSVTEVEHVDDENALDMRHFSTPYCLVALLRSGLPFHQKEIYKSFYRLLQSQHTFGYWTNKLLPGQVPIWAIHDSLFAVAEAKDSVATKLANVNEEVIAKQELAVLQRSVACVLTGAMSQGVRGGFWARNRWTFIWNSLITAYLIYLGVRLNSLQPSSTNFFASLFSSYLSTIILALVTGLAPFLYQILLEEYKTRRKTRAKSES